MRWLLDSDTVICAIRRWPEAVRGRVDQTDRDDVVVSVVTVAELWYGAERFDSPERRRLVFEAFLEPYLVLPFDRTAAECHGRIRHALRRTPIGERDLLVASIALANDLTVVTANTREFRRVPGLRVEDWSGVG